MPVEVDGSPWKGKGHKIRCYDYVNHPYERVRHTLKKKALIVFETATNTAASRAQSVVAELRVDFAVSASRRISRLISNGIDEKAARSGSMRTTKLTLKSDVSKMPRLFPHEGRAFGVSVDCDRNLVEFCRRLQDSLRHCGEGHERDCRPTASRRYRYFVL